jgi:amino acid adenylation domain-containing protein
MKHGKDSAANTSVLSAEERELFAVLLAEEGIELPQTRGIEPRTESGPLPLSFAQQRLWFLHQLEPDNPVYNLPLAVRFTGALHVEALAQTVNEIVRRHEALRTTFKLSAGQPAQIIAPKLDVPLPLVDLSGVPAQEREAEAQRQAQSEALLPFDLAAGPLLRARLFKLAADEHIVLLTMHHIVSDGWSFSVLVREVAALYEAFVAGRPSPLAELRIQYADYAVWQREWLTGEVLETQTAYWRQQLAGAPILELPTDRPRPALQSFRGATERLTVDRAVTDRLNAISQREGATLFMTLMAAFKVLLARYTRQTDIVVGTPIAGRNRAEIEDLIGFFLNTLALRTDLSGDPRFVDLLAREREVTLGAYAHQDVPFEKLVDELQPERNLSHTPLFQVVFTFQNAPRVALDLRGLQLRAQPLEGRTAKFDLTLVMEETTRGLSGAIEYNTDLFDAATIRRMSAHFQTLLQAIAARPAERISRLPLVTPAERRELLRAGQPDAQTGARHDYARSATLHELFEAQAERAPDSVALSFEDEQVTYAELNRRANRLAHYLKGQGVGPDVLVGLWLERSVEMVVALLGVLKAGGAYVPLDLSYPPERVSFMLADAGVAVLLTQAHLVEHLPAHTAQVLALDAASEALARESEANPAQTATPAAAAYVIYTSGSTGTPKGVVVTHANVTRLFAATERWFNFDARDVWTLFHSYAFDFSVWELWGALAYGGRLVIVPYWVSRAPEAFYELLVRERVTVLNQTPSAFRQLIGAEESAQHDELPALALRFVIFGGEALELQSLRPWFARHADTAPQLVNMYGITETTVHVTYRPIRLRDVESNAGSVIGGPIPDLQLYVLDEQMEPAPLGVAGELYVGGAGLARGYLHRAELTATRFVPDPFGLSSGARLYRTGDLARRLANGDLEYLGRIDNQVKIRGFRIELGEIEAALMSHQDVRAAVVVARAGEQGERRLVAYLVSARERAPQTSEVRSFLKTKLPEHMIPAAFVVLDELPLTAHGKVDLRALPEPERAREQAGADYVAPRNASEEVLAAVWAEALGLERVGVNDNFFELGGDSILSVRLLAAAKERGLDFTLQQLFQHQTIAELAGELHAAELGPHRSAQSEPFSLVAAADRALLPADLVDAYPLTMLQAGMLYHMELMPESAVYHNINSWHLRARFDLAAFTAAVEYVVARHPVLRTSFDLTSYSEPLQLVHERATLPIALSDLRHLPTAEQDAAIDAYVAAERHNRFDLAVAPLLRFHIHLREHDSFQFSLTECHAIFDGWSLNSTLAEIFGRYFALLAGEAPADEPPPAATFRDFVRLERAALNSPECRNFWQERLRGSTVMRLPRWPAATRPTGAARFRWWPVEMPAGLGAELQQVAHSAKVPLKSVLLAAHVKVLSLLSGLTDVLCGLSSNGRSEELDGERVRGLFLNTLPFRLQVASGTWADLIQQTFNAEWEMLPYRRFPLFELQRQQGGQPLFETQFNFVHFHTLTDVLRSGHVEVLTPDSRIIEEVDYTLDASFSLNPLTRQLHMGFKYDAHELSEPQMAAITGYYLNALGAMTRDLHARHEATSLLAPTEERQLIYDWNDTARAFPAAHCPHELFEQQVERTPDAVALVYEDAQLTYAELDHRANQLAHHLRGLGVGPETLVGIMVERSLEMIVGLLGILKAGGAYVGLDPALPQARLAYMLADAELSILLTQQHLRSLLPAHAAQIVCLDADWPLITRHDERRPAHGPAPEHLAQIIYTSGSTGRPKGVATEHRQLTHYLRGISERLELRPGASFALHQTLAVDAPITYLWASLTTGGVLHIIAPERATDAAALAAYFKQHQIDYFKTAPSHLAALQATGDPAGVMPRHLLMLGGEALGARLAEQLRHIAPDCIVLNHYGPTETTCGVLTHRVTPDADLSQGETVPLGRPLANSRIYVLDAALRPAPIGVAGEVYIGGDGLARGYLGRPELTAERFIPDPFSRTGGERLYKTGDTARYLPDGTLEFIGRVDHQVKVRGFRIELEEIEAALARHTNVRTAVVTAHADGAGDRMLVAYVVATTEGQPTVSELRAYLRAELPDYMIPAVIMLLDELPRTPQGKVDRKALPAPARGAQTDEYVPPRTPTETRLAAIWTEVLRVEPISTTANFFALGGHSLLAMQLIARVRQTFGVETPLSRLFTEPTLAHLAQCIDAESATTAQQESGPPLVPVVRDGRPMPVSYAQQRLWFMAQLEPESTVYNIPLAVRLRGALQVPALEQALGEIVRRHETLRTTFDAVGGQPVQVIAPPQPFKLPLVDLSVLPAAEREAEVRRLGVAEVQRPFDLAQGPLLRALLVRLAPDEHVALLTMHHIISDGWSRSILIREVGALYDAFATERPSPLPELPLQYADYAAWQRAWLSTPVLAEQLAYWRQQLAGAPPVLELPTDYPRAMLPGPGGASKTVRLPESLTGALKALGQTEGATLFMTLLAAWQALLARYTGQTDIVVGTPMANRPRPELEDLIGFFISTLVLRTDLAGRPTFRELLARVRAVTLGAYAHQDVPFEMLVEELQPERGLSHAPLFQVAFNLHNTPREALTLAGLELAPVEVAGGTTVFDLTLTAMEADDGLFCALEYKTELFAAATAERMLGHFAALLASVAAQPDARLADLPLLSDAEQQQQLVAWNDTRRAYPSACIHELFAAQAERTPDVVAAQFGDEQITYGALNARANRVAHRLQGLGVGPDMLVGLFTERSVDMLVGMLGILKAGGAYLPLDTQYPPARLAFMLADAGVSVLLTQTQLGARLPEHDAQVLYLDDAAAFAAEQTTNPASNATAEHLAYVIYTSGSTGQAKGVSVPHRAVVRLVHATNYVQLNSADRIAQASNASFDAATFEIWGALLNGAQLVGIDKDVVLSPADFAAELCARQVSVLFLTTALFNQLARTVPTAFESLRYLLFGGEAVEPKWVRAVLSEGPPEHLRHVYGPTENTTFSTWHEVRAVAPTAATVPIGGPLMNTQAYVLDARQRLVPLGVAGELYLGGAGLARDYLNRPELTAERFVPHPYSDVPGARLYRTGDQVRLLPDGAIEFLGRFDMQVKLRGFRIELGEIEAALAAHEAVRECVVTAREDARGDKYLVGYTVARAGARVPAHAELRAYLRERLPDYMLPAAFVWLAELPLTPNGKVNRKALPAPDATRQERDAAYVAPRSALEELLAGLWAEVLQVERVGATEDFFELGGHSLMATQLIARVREVCRVELPLRALFEVPTVAGLAAYIEAELRAGSSQQAPPLVAHAHAGVAPLSFAQQRLWFLDQFAPGSNAYNIPAAVQLSGALDRAALERALLEVVRRHEALRTTFALRDGEPAQLIAAAPEQFALPVVDLRALAADERAAAAQKLSADEARRPFDLTTGPLLRCTLLQLADTEHVVLLTVHHIIADGWSLDVLVREVAALYAAFAAGQPSPLAALPIQYANFAVWQREWLTGAVLDEQLAYWRAQLADVAVLALPTDRPRPRVQTFNGANHLFRLDRQVRADLQTLSRREGLTLFMTMLAGFQALLARYSGQADISVGTPVAGRTRLETESLIGFFVNTLAMRTRVAADDSFAALLGRVREVVLGAHAHQDVPFERIVEELQPARNLSHTPLFQVMLTWQSAARETLTVEGLSLRTQDVANDVAKFDLTLHLYDTPDGLAARFEYNTDLFDAATIARMAGHFETLLQSAAAAPDLPLGQLQLLSTAERQQVLVAFNDTQVEYPADVCLHELFEAQVAATPDAPALVFEDTRLSYADLNRRANQLAHHLQGLGVGPEVLVGVLMERSVEMVVSLLAILKAGGAYVPLDPDYPRERLQFMLADAAVPVLLTQARVVGALPELGARVVYVDRDWPEIAAERTENPVSGVTDDNLVYVIYTSGSTGRPKGALLPHRGVVNCVRWMQATYRLDASDRFLLKTSLNFDPSVWEVFWTLGTGACLHVARPGGHLDSTYLARYIVSHELTSIYFVPSMLRVFLDEPEAARCTSLRRIICGGEALSLETMRRCYELLPAVELHHSYGPTETSIAASEWTCDATSARRQVSMGYPLANTQTYVLDAALEPVPVGVAGELCIGGVGLGRGYLGRAALTAERFIPDPFSEAPGARLYRTGDVVRYAADGSLEFVGRADQQVKVRGFRVELGEIEAALMSHPGVRECAVVAQADGAGGQRLVGYFVAAQDDAPAVEELRRHLLRQLPDYMVPTAWLALPALPLMLNGKVDHKALPAPPTLRPQLTAQYVAPATEAERILTEIWQRVLQVEQVGVEDNFFDLGGHSLLLLKVHGEVQQAFGRELPVVELFQYPTISTLAAHLSRTDDAAATLPTSEERTATRKRLAQQQRSRRTGRTTNA